MIVTGRGRGFCAGADLSGGGDTFAGGGGGDKAGPEGVPRDGGGLVSLRIFNSLKPVIAAINGPAVGVGVTMTLPMDIRLASENARIGFVFARRGIVPEACSSWFLPRLVGIQQATEWVFTGRVFPATEALAGGLVRSVHAPDDLLAGGPRPRPRDRREHRAGVDRAVAPDAVADARCAPIPWSAHQVDSRGIAERGRSDDAREGVVSFLEKRPPAFPVKVSDGLPADLPGLGGSPVRLAVASACGAG